MAQQAPRQAGTKTETTASSEGPTAVVRKVLNCCIGRHNETLRDAGGTITETTTTSPSVFDVLVSVEFADTPRIVHSKSVGQYGIEELGFWGIRATDNGDQLTTFSFEYEGDLYGIQVIVTDDEGGNGGER